MEIEVKPSAESQFKKIQKHIDNCRVITPLEAFNEYGCLRLGAVIHRLRKQGYNIQTDINKAGKPYAIYTLLQKGGE